MDLRVGKSFPHIHMHLNRIMDFNFGTGGSTIEGVNISGRVGEGHGEIIDGIELDLPPFRCWAA